MTLAGDCLLGDSLGGEAQRMTLNIQISKKFNDGTILVVGGENYQQFGENLQELIGESGTADVLAEFMNLVPVADGFAAASAAINHGFPQNDQPRQGAGAPPGDVTLCPTHGQPATYREGGTSQSTRKPYAGFWKCPVTGESISAFGGKGLKSACPDRK